MDKHGLLDAVREQLQFYISVYEQIKQLRYIALSSFGGVGACIFALGQNQASCQSLC